MGTSKKPIPPHAGRAACALALLALSACNPGPPPDGIACETDDDCQQGSELCIGNSTCQEQVLTTDEGPWRIKSCVFTPNTRCACLAVPDADRDSAESMACGGTDCDDNDPLRAPGRPEVCDDDDRDEDCDPATFGERDADGDGIVDANCCNGGLCGTDCNDARPTVHPHASEVCDGIDNDCDGAIDEGVNVLAYRDEDFDGFGVGEQVEVCADTSGYATVGGDCDDALTQVHPGAVRCAAGGSGAQIELCQAEAWVDDTCPGLGLCVEQPDGTGECLPGDVFPECADGVDNDDDGSVDMSDPQCTTALDNTEAQRACENGLDDDADGLTDYPNDPGCSAPSDTKEADPTALPACSNGLDDDNDGTRDYVLGSGDPGCVSAADDSEREAAGPSCDNGVDDDGDLAIDFPADKSCAGPSSDGEGTPACDNGRDDDLDGLTDFGSDPGCDGATDDSERAENGNLICDNAVDDDFDGASDFPGDVGCTSPQDSTEQ